jgi:SAM-dependent methyltransferase
VSSDGPEWTPAGSDLSRPSAARMYDYYLGGSHNFAVDREAAEQAISARPEIPALARANRTFLHRAVRYLLAQGIRQFLDIGSGIPTAGNVHQIAQAEAPGSRVVYVDLDPVAVAHSQALLADNPDAAAVQGDVREPAAIVAHAEVRRLLDLDQPVALLLVSVLHFVPDTHDPVELLGVLRDAVAPGSYLVVSYATPTADPRANQQLHEVYRQSNTRGAPRYLDAVQGFFTGFELLDPGLVLISQWRPESPEEAVAVPSDAAFYAAVARKP